MLRPKLIAALAGAALALTACTATTPAPAPTPTSTASAEPTTLQLGLAGGDTDVRHDAAAALAEQVSAATEGRVTLEITTGGEAASVEDGTLDLAVVDSAQLTELNPDFGTFALPYAFDSAETQARVLSDAAVVGDLYGSLADSHHLTVLTGLYAGARNVANNAHAVNTPADLSGLRLAVTQSDTQVQVIEALGAIAVPFAADQIHAAIAAGTLQGVEDTQFGYGAQNLAGTANFVSLTGHQLVPDYLVANSDSLASLSDADRQALLAALPAAATAANGAVATAEQAGRTDAESKGVAYNDVDKASFQAATESMVKAYLSTPAREALYSAGQA